MIKVKSYRPLVTENLVWDFPSRLKLNAISDFLGSPIAEITDFVSQTAKDTMSNKSVYWFVSDKSSGDVIALISLSDIDFDKGSAVFGVEFANSIPDDFCDEILYRLFLLVHDQISLNELRFEKIPSKVSKFFTLNGYTLNNNKLKRM
ncbi:hypothetical protein [Companilactobacillus furfuricola]|uniref:hypothetical protein n=1 Tax=Companilactobacillus furfuricola TaxID=1462575 RepID=UPI000F787B52|nr:hypothetical protein [Companilactobacillus furfuricola]